MSKVQQCPKCGELVEWSVFPHTCPEQLTSGVLDITVYPVSPLASDKPLYRPEREWRERAERAEAAIRQHRDQRGDDRCWMDDEALYAILPEGFTPTARDTTVELELCRKFIECRRNPATTYISPQRRIEELEAALVPFAALGRMAHIQSSDGECGVLVLARHCKDAVRAVDG